MICKEDVIQWFKNLESYERIDIMCTLLSMCLPFELRFLGTCLEDLGRRDSQEFRVMELRVNNPQELASDMVECQKGEPTDRKIRRKMALYLALIRSCNRTCVAEIFHTLDSWGQRDFNTLNDLDTLQELLLVYIMAANHPVFSFEQHMKCTDIFEKIRINKLLRDEAASIADTPPPMSSMLNSQHTSLPPQLSHLQPLNAVAYSPLDMHAAVPPTQPSQEFPQGMHAMHPTFILQPGFNPQIPVDATGLAPVPSIPIDPKAYTVWLQPSIEPPPQSTSPLLSQQSSPSSSRAGSPNRGAQPSINISSLQQLSQQPQIRNMPQRIGSSSIKNVRRPSADTTPPPMTQQQQLSNDILPVQQNSKILDDSLNDASVTHVIRNGYRNMHRTKVKGGLSHHQQQSPINHIQQFQALAAGNFNQVAGLQYPMQNMSLNEPQMAYVQMESGLNMSSKSGGSDSGSSIGSSGEISPSETPTIMTSSATTTNAIPGGGNILQSQSLGQKHQMHQVNHIKQLPLSRINGRGEKVIFGSGVSGANASSVGTTSLIFTGSQQTQTHIGSQPQHHFAETILAPGGNAGVSATTSGPSVNLLQSSTIGSNNNLVGGLVASPNSNFPLASNNNSTVLITPSPVSTINNVILPQQQPSQQQPPAQTNQQQSQQPQTFTPAYAPFVTAPWYVVRGTTAGVGVTPTQSVQHPGTATSGIANPLQPIMHPVMLRNDPRLITFPPFSPHPATAAAAAAAPVGASVGASAGVTISSTLPKPISCYNCGSQTHIGRDCQEANMEDVTRRTIYKLDYSASTLATGATNTLTTVSSGNNLLERIGVSSNSSSASSSLATDNNPSIQTPQQQQQQQPDSLHSNPASIVGAGISSTVQAAPSVQPLAVASNK